ncbi:unnamed protein product [Penicillium olsonii]|nr:unnamed protein product [Penicillium olsonii]CAG7927599.1 unnamed protein product [Penicillium olsonii]
MDFRLMARGLRARPTPFLQQTQALPRFSLLSVRYNSSNSSSNTPSQPPATESKPEQPKSVTDFDDILTKLDLNQRPRDNQNSHRIFADSLSRAVGQGAQGAARLRSRPAAPARKIELKLGPTLGRQAHVDPNRGNDLASALRKLGQNLATNKVRQESAAQRFHVRKGMVRKQKKMQRWKKLFKVSFQGTVKKIQRMQAQGW